MRIVVPLSKACHPINHGACPVLPAWDGARRDAAPINWTMPTCDDPFPVAPCRTIQPLLRGLWRGRLILDALHRRRRRKAD